MPAAQSVRSYHEYMHCDLQRSERIGVWTASMNFHATEFITCDVHRRHGCAQL